MKKALIDQPAGNQRFSIVPSASVTDNEIPDGTFRTLAALGVFGDKNGWCFPGLEKLSKMRGISRMAVSKHISKLVELGYLEKYPRYDKETNARKSNLLRIRLDTPSTSEVYTPENFHSPSVYTPEKILSPEVYVNAPVNALKNEDALSQENYDKANKFVDAVLTNERIAQEKIAGGAWSGRETIPEPIRDLLDVFVSITGQRPTKSKLMEWLATGSEWQEMSATVQDVRDALKIARPEKGDGFLVNRPGSLTNTIAMVIGKRRSTSDGGGDRASRILNRIHGGKNE
jgi:hypothetical protein